LIGTLIVGTAQIDIDLAALQEKLKLHIAQIEVLGYARPTH
jgi:D-methionine transport system ATP-binding protein